MKTNLLKKLLVFAVCASAVASENVFAKKPLNGNDKNTASRQNQVQAQVDEFKNKKVPNENVVYQYTVGDDNISLLCSGQSFFGNTLGFSHFEVDGDRADWVNWKDQIQALNEEFSFYFTDYELPECLGGIYVYNMYGTQYIWNGGEIVNPYEGWRNDCNNATFFVSRTWAQANYQDRADRCNFAFWVDYTNYTKKEIAKYFADSSLPSEFSEIHWRNIKGELNGEAVNCAVYCNFKVSLHQWFNIVCIETSRGFVPVYFEKVCASGGNDSIIGLMAKSAFGRFQEAMEAYKAEEIIPENSNGDPEDDLNGVQPDYYFDNNPEDQTKESHDA